ncbi:hypothetical protein TorRG33x02_333170, partial [Trema orientale]
MAQIAPPSRNRGAVVLSSGCSCAILAPNGLDQIFDDQIFQIQPVLKYTRANLNKTLFFEVE